MSDYTGKFKQVLSSGEVIDVAVVDSTGISTTLTPQEYKVRGIKPPIEDLPTQYEYKK